MDEPRRKFVGRENEFETQDYKTWTEAAGHYRDIVGFEGIWDCRIVEYPSRGDGK